MGVGDGDACHQALGGGSDGDGGGARRWIDRHGGLSPASLPPWAGRQPGDGRCQSLLTRLHVDALHVSKLLEQAHDLLRACASGAAVRQAHATRRRDATPAAL